MLIDTLDDIAEAYKIPNKKHEMLHVNSRECWINLVSSVIESEVIKPNKKIIHHLAKNWEIILCNKFSLLN